MFELNQIHLSGSAGIISLCDACWSDQEVYKLGDIDLIFIYTENEPHLKLEVFLRANDEYLCIPNNFIYNLVLKNQNNVSESIHWQLKIDQKSLLFEDVPNNKQWISQDDNKHGFSTFYFWRQVVPDKSVDLTDCMINVQNAENAENFNSNKSLQDSFRANVYFLAKSSHVIYDMIKNLQQNYCPQNPLDLSQLFEGFSERHVHMYLCSVYNSDFKFNFLFDIVEVLKLSIKLDNQSLIQHIMDMESLKEIIYQQSVGYDKDHKYNIESVLDFAKKHDLHTLVFYCQLEYFRQLEQKGKEISGHLKAHLDVYKCET